MDPLRCLQAADSNLHQVDQLYLSETNEGNLWERTGVTPPCSSVSPPPPSRCLVCVQKTVYAVCNKVTSNLTMEGEGRHIPVRESDCPVFMATAPPEHHLNTNSTGSPTDSSEHLWWLLIIPIILIIIMIGAVVYRKRKDLCAALQRCTKRGTFHRCRAENPDGENL